MLDPNPNISGKGQRRLREANIRTDLFPPDLMAQIEELNRAFARAYGGHNGTQRQTARDIKSARAVTDVLAWIDDRVRTASLLAFEPEWKNFSETYWLIGPITIENRRDAAISLDGYFEASHSQGPITFHVEAMQFRHWERMIRTTHQASAPQLVLPISVAARHTVRGIVMIRFPTSEFGGFGRYREGRADWRWVVPLRLPYEWNPTPSPSLPST
jgi:hypothetical protein